MGKIIEREPHPDDRIYKEGLRMYSVRFGPRRGADGPEIAEIYGPARPLVRSENLPPGWPRSRGGSYRRRSTSF